MARRQNEIRNVSELPSWYCLDKYDKSKDLDSADWHYQLSLRSDCYVSVYAICDKDSSYHGRKLADNKELLTHYEETFKLMTTLLRLDPVPQTDPNHGRTTWMQGLLGRPFRSGVSSMTVRDLRQFERRLSVGRKKYSRRWIDGIDSAFSGQDGVVYGGKDWISAPLYESHSCRYDKSLRDTTESRTPWGETAVTVQIDLPDAVLIEDFKNWLSHIKKKRTAPAVEKRYRRADFESWVAYGVLPFLDLLIWAKEKNVCIPNRVMADAVFQPWERDAETIRKTIAPLAMRLISESADGVASPLSLLAAEAGRKIDYPEAESLGSIPE